MSACYRIVVLAMLVAGAGWSAPAALAQKEVPVSSLADINEMYGNGKTIAMNLKKDLGSAGYSRDDNMTADNKRVLEVTAAYFVCRITWKENVDDPEKMAAALEDFKTLFSKSGYPALHQNQYFHKQLADNFKLIFERPFLENRLTSLNAAQLLPGLGKGKSPDISDLLTDYLINDPTKHEAIKLYAIQALADYFPLTAVQDARDLKRVDTLMKYIERKDWPVAPEKKTKEKDKEKDKGSIDEDLVLASYFRCKAIQVLARAQLPAVKVKKDAKQGQLAVTLLKVLARKELTPPPPAPGETLQMMGLEERCHASFGLCDMKPDADYRPDLCVYAMGHCLTEFFEAYQKDEANKTKGAFLKSGEKRTYQLHWKSLAERWKEGLKNLERNTAANQNVFANNQTKQLQKHVEKMLNIVATTGIMDAKQAEVFFGEKQAFENFLRADEQKRVPPTPLFKGNTAREVNLGYD
jgi:hypothetical protein